MEETTRAMAERANQQVKQIIDLDHKIKVAEGKLNQQLQAVKDKFGPEIEQLKQQRDTTSEALKSLVLPHFDQLAAPGTKTIKLRHGEISQRQSAESLEVIGNEQDVIARVRKAGGVRRFIRRKETLDKVALKKDPKFVSKIQGLAIIRKTSVVIKPSKAQGEIVLSENPVVISESKED